MARKNKAVEQVKRMAQARECDSDMMRATVAYGDVWAVADLASEQATGATMWQHDPEYSGCVASVQPGSHMPRGDRYFIDDDADVGEVLSMLLAAAMMG